MQTHAFSGGSVCGASIHCFNLCGMVCLNVRRCCGWLVLNSGLCSGCFVLIFGLVSICLSQAVGLASACMSPLEPWLWMACLKFALGFCWLGSAWFISAQRSIAIVCAIFWRSASRLAARACPHSASQWRRRRLARMERRSQLPHRVWLICIIALYKNAMKSASEHASLHAQTMQVCG